MLDRHAVHALLKAGRSTKEIALQMGVTARTIQRIAKEPPVEEGDDGEARRRRGVGRPAVPEGTRLRLRDLIAADPEAPPLEFLRQLREEGTPLGGDPLGQLPAFARLRVESCGPRCSSHELNESSRAFQACRCPPGAENRFEQPVSSKPIDAYDLEPKDSW